MEILLLILLLAGPCSSSDGEDLFCEGPACDAMALDDGAGGAGGTGDGVGAGSTSGGHEGSSVAGQGGAGGAGGDDGPPPCECDDGNPCNGIEVCAGDGSCVTTGEPEPLDDLDACTEDYCVDGAPVNEELPVDDEDPCTRDYCDHDLGIIHHPIAACGG